MTSYAEAACGLQTESVKSTKEILNAVLSKAFNTFAGNTPFSRNASLVGFCDPVFPFLAAFFPYCSTGAKGKLTTIQPKAAQTMRCQEQNRNQTYFSLQSGDYLGERMTKLLFKLCYSPTAYVRLRFRHEMVAADYQI